MTPRESSGILARPPRIHGAPSSEGIAMSVVRKSLVALAAVAVCAIAPLRAAAPDTGQLKVTVDYKGPGTVDKSHQIFVWVFDTPGHRRDLDADLERRHHRQRRHGFVLGPAEDGLPRRRIQREGRLRRHAGSAADRNAGDRLRRHGHGDRRSQTGGAEATVTITFDDSAQNAVAHVGTNVAQACQACRPQRRSSDLHVLRLARPSAASTPGPPLPIRRRRCCRRDRSIALCGQTNFPTGNASRGPLRIGFHESMPASPSCSITLLSAIDQRHARERSGTTITPLRSLK